MASSNPRIMEAFWFGRFWENSSIQSDSNTIIMNGCFFCILKGVPPNQKPPSNYPDGRECDEIVLFLEADVEVDIIR